MKRIKEGSIKAVTVASLRASEWERNHRKAAARIRRQEELELARRRRDTMRYLQRGRALGAGGANGAEKEESEP